MIARFFFKNRLLKVKKIGEFSARFLCIFYNMQKIASEIVWKILFCLYYFFPECGKIYIIISNEEIIMNKQALATMRILYISAIVFSVLFTLLRCYMVLTGYDASSGFYTSAPLHHLLRYGLFLFAALVFIASHIYIKEENDLSPLPQNRFSRIGSCILGAALCGFALYTLAKALLFHSAYAADLIACPFALLAAFYQWTNFRGKHKTGDFRGLLTLCGALVCLSVVFGLYFNPHLSYINHTVVLAFAAFVFLMLTAAAEANFEIGRSAYRRLFSYAPISIVFTLTLAVPDFVYRFVRGNLLLSDIFYDILLLAFGLYYFAKLTAVLTARGKKTED